MKLDFRSLEKVSHSIIKIEISKIFSAVCTCFAIDNKRVSHTPLIAKLTASA